MVWWVVLGIIIAALSAAFNLLAVGSEAVYFGIRVAGGVFSAKVVALAFLWMACAYGFYKKTDWLPGLFLALTVVDVVLTAGNLYSARENVLIVEKTAPELGREVAQTAFYVGAVISLVVLALQLAVLFFVYRKRKLFEKHVKKGKAAGKPARGE